MVKNKNVPFYMICVSIVLFLFIFCVITYIVKLIFKGKNINTNTNTNNNIIKCNMKYGLCPAAKCVPNPYVSSKAYCFCDVANGTNYSVGNNICKNIKPYTTKTGEEIIFSDFSPIIEKMGYHLETCPSKSVNLNCMNKICSVDPNNPSKAICICDQINNENLDWVTFNKNGEHKTCDYQSGSSVQNYIELMDFIKQNP